MEKLSTFRRRDVGCVMLFARAAAASGAKELAIERGRDGIVFRFDGRPFERRELADPFGVLFDEGGGGDERRRWLALAMIHAWRPSLAKLTVASGKAPDGASVEADGLGSEKVENGGTDDGRTTVTLTLSKSDEGHWRHPAAPELIVCNPRSHLWGRMAVSVSNAGKVEGRFVPSAAGPGELAFDEGGVFGHISVPPEPGLESSVDAYIHGVYAGRLDWRDPLVPVVGKADDPTLALDASLASVVQNERRERLEELVRRKAFELALRAAREQPGLIDEVGRFLKADEGLRVLWRRRLDGPGVEADRGTLVASLAERLFGGGQRKEREGRVLYAACVTSWLRHVGVAMGTRGRDGLPADFWAALQAAPVAFFGGWRPANLAELRAAGLERRLKAAPDVTREDSAGAVWKDGGQPAFWASIGLMDF